MEETNERDFGEEFKRLWPTYTLETARLVRDMIDELNQTRKERDQWRNAHNMMAEGNHVVILERDDYKLEIETMPTLEEYNDVCSELINCKKERDAKFSIEEVELAYRKRWEQVTTPERFDKVFVDADWDFFLKELLKSKEEKEG